MLFAECVSGWRGGGSFAFMDGAQRSGAFIFSVTLRLLSSQHWETFIKIIHFSHQILWSRDDSWALFAGHGVQHHLKVTAFSIFGSIRLRELRTKSKEETFFHLRLAASFVLVSFPHECLFSRPFRGQVPNGSRGQWSWKRPVSALLVKWHFLLTSAVILPHKEIAKRVKNGFQKDIAVNFPITSITGAPSLAGDMIFAWRRYLALGPLLLNVLGQTWKLHQLELWGCTGKWDSDIRTDLPVLVLQSLVL